VTTFAYRGRPAATAWVLTSALALVLLGAAIAVLVVLLKPGEFRSPIDPIANGWGPDTKSPLFYRSIYAPFEGKTNYILRFRPHARFRFGIDVHNRGSAPVRIEGLVTGRKGCCATLRYASLQLQHRPNAYVLAGSTSEPLTIPPDGYGYVIPTMETGARCYMDAGGAEVFQTVSLKYSYRGKNRTEDYSLPAVIGIVCNRPKQVIDQVLGP
jgi:hypothetical protein